MSPNGGSLGRVLIVLWQPQDVVNIAGTVRAMKNFGLDRLRLVSPAEWDPWRIEGIAHDTADVVEKAELHESIDTALADCSYVVAMTARGRRAKRAVDRPRGAAQAILERAEAGGDSSVAILFGREDIGLPNEILDLCHLTVTIPTRPDHPSLNLAQAVLVIAYELWMTHAGGLQEFKRPRRVAAPVTVHLLERLFEDTERALWAIDFFKSRQTEGVMRTLRGLAHRADFDEREAGLLRAIAIEITKHVARIEGQA